MLYSRCEFSVQRIKRYTYTVYITGDFSGGGGGGAKFRYYWCPVSGMKVKTHKNVNLCTTSKCEVFRSRN